MKMNEKKGLKGLPSPAWHEVDPRLLLHCHVDFSLVEPILRLQVLAARLPRSKHVQKWWNPDILPDIFCCRTVKILRPNRNQWSPGLLLQPHLVCVLGPGVRPPWRSNAPWGWDPLHLRNLGVAIQQWSSSVTVDDGVLGKFCKNRRDIR